MEKSVQEFIAKSNKEYGQNTIILGKDCRMKVDIISTGSLKIDIATGIGGIPKGRVVEVFGEESSGKSTLALHVAANVQKAGGNVLYIDAENALDPTYASRLGVNLEEVAISQPDNAEQAIGLVKSATSMRVFDLIVLDTIAAMTPRAIIDGEVGDAHMASMARLLSANLSYICDGAAKGNTSVLCLNQVRNTNFSGYGNPLGTSGGRAMRFYTSMRIQMTRSTLNKDGTVVAGNTVKVKIVKNKLAPPFTECEPEIVYGEGFSREHEIVDLGSDNGLIDKAGSWYSYKGERIGQGADTVAQFLVANPKITDELETAIKERLGM